MESAPENPFDNKVVIVDEVHNLISRVVGGGTGLRLYNLLMKAENIRLVLLSGTPLINYPYESAFLLNLLRGNIYEFTIKFNVDKKNKSFDDLISIFNKNQLIDQIFIDEKTRTVSFTRNPQNFSPNLGSFENVDETEFKMSPTNKDEYVSNAIFMKSIETMLKSRGFSIKSTKINKYLALPTEEKKFDKMFINHKTSEVVNHDLFIRRILGTISYYKGARADLFPRTSGITPIYVPMSDYQFAKYESIRQIERKKERSKKMNQKKKKDENNISSYYRVFSRAFGNFVFPESIERPLPGSKTLTEDEKESSDVSEVEEDFEIDTEKIKKVKKNHLYEEAKEIALTNLEKQSSLYLVPGEKEGLQKYSPKFFTMLENINISPGSVFVYSQLSNRVGE